MLAKYVRCAHLPGHITPHTMRHTCGTELYKATGDVVSVAKYLRHSSTRTTTKVYVTLATKDLMEIASKHPINKIISELKNEHKDN
ncbi:MAG: tyrosine-type recombinase/integrase [Elusimicrobiota bacterium]